MTSAKGIAAMGVLLSLVSSTAIAQLAAKTATIDTNIIANRAFTKTMSLSNATVIPKYRFNDTKAMVLIPPTAQPAEEEAEDGPPTGPSGQISATLLADVFDAASPKHIRDDFDNRIPFSDQLFRDHTSLNTYYFYPSGYLIKRDATDGFDINFLHRTRSDGSPEELIVLTFTLVPRDLDGGMNLVRKLAALGIEPPANRKSIELTRLPISKVKVSMAGLSSLIPEENVKVINNPNVIGDPIRVQATMNQSQKEDLVASIRSGGLSGDITFDTNNGSFRIEIPYVVSFTDYSGDWLTDITQLSNDESLRNVSPFPLVFTGVVAYVQSSTNQQIKRYEIPVGKPVLMEPGALASADRTFQQLTSSYGTLIAAWPNYERIKCDECLNAIEQKILVSPAQARKTELPIEAIPTLFDQFSIFKILVEIRSTLFSPNNQYQESKVFTLRQSESQASATLYVNRDENTGSGNFEYRVKAILNNGEDSVFSNWKGDQGVMDITVTAADIRGQLTENNDD